jgi:hypothetical protein
VRDSIHLPTSWQQQQQRREEFSKLLDRDVSNWLRISSDGEINADYNHDLDAYFHHDLVARRAD